MSNPGHLRRACLYRATTDLLLSQSKERAVGIPRFITSHLRPAEPEPRHSRVIRPGDASEWVSIVHKNGSISEVEVSADNDDVSIGIAMADAKELHLRRPWG